MGMVQWLSCWNEQRKKIKVAWKIMTKYEVEHRGLLTAEKYDELIRFFDKNAKNCGTKKRFSIIYSTSKKSVREIKDDPIDLKLRVTNGKSEIALKYGKWSGKDARREFGFEIDTDQYDDFIEFLKILGYHKAVLMDNIKHDYIYRGIEFSLVEVPHWGYYFEAEIMSNEKEIDKANKKLDSEIAALGLVVLGEQEFYDLLDEFNNRPGYRIDLKKVTPDELRIRFGKYFTP